MQQTSQHKKTRRFSDYMRIMIHQRATPESIGRGVCVGLIVAFSPLYGMHMLIAFLLAVIARASKPAAMISVWVSNPFTAVPMLSFAYWIGCLVWPNPAQEKPFQDFVHFIAYHLHWESLEEGRLVLSEMLRVSKDILIPLSIGGLVAGAVSSAVCYPLTLIAVRRLRKTRSLRLKIKLHRSKP